MGLIPRVSGHSNACRWARKWQSSCKSHLAPLPRAIGPPGFNHAEITFEKQNLIIGLAWAIVLHSDFSLGELRAGLRGAEEPSHYSDFPNQGWDLVKYFLLVKFRRVASDFVTVCIWFQLVIYLPYYLLWFVLRRGNVLGTIQGGNALLLQRTVKHIYTTTYKERPCVFLG